MSHLLAKHPDIEPVGANLSSTGLNVTISPTTTIHHVTGIGSIQTINLPYTGFTGILILIPDGLFTLTTGGNISIGVTAVVSRPLYLAYDGTMWYPSYL